VPMSKFPPVKPQRPGPTSRSSTTVCPEPIDLELDHKNRVLYWADRGDLQHRGNSMVLVGGISRIVVRPTSSTGARIILVAVSLLMLSIRKMSSDFGALQRQWWRVTTGTNFKITELVCLRISPGMCC
jgi:hypothetical protein